MPRSVRKISKTGIYHVMLRGINKQLIFEEPADYLKFLDCLFDVKEISGFKLYAYCLMGNHIHMLIKEVDEPLSSIFKRIGARYVFWFNWKYERSGHLFQDRFKSEPIENDEYFISVLLYIYQNPVKAGLCENATDYIWCSRNQLGNGGIVDEAELFGIVPIESIIEREKEELICDALEQKSGRRTRVTDDDVLRQMNLLGELKNTADFRGLDEGKQVSVIIKLRTQGASIRQLARLSGLGKGVVERMCKKGDNSE